MSDPITTRAIELLAAVELERTKLLDTVDRIERSTSRMEALLATLVALSKPKPGPAPETPSLPPKTDAMLLYQPTWRDVTLHKPGDVGAGLLWVRGNQVAGQETAVNSERASSEIVGDVLQLRLAPATLGEQVASRAVLTNERTQWTALKPYAGTTLYSRFWLTFDELPQVDMNASGRFASLWQGKDLPDKGALFQLNMDGDYRLWLGTRRDPPPNLRLTKLTAPPPFVAGVEKQIDIAHYMTASPEGYFVVSVDGVPMARADGVTAGIAGYISWHLCYYTNALKSASELEVGGVVISTEPIP